MALARRVLATRAANAPLHGALRIALELFDGLRLILDRLHWAAASEADSKRLYQAQHVTTVVLAAARVALGVHALSARRTALIAALVANVAEADLCALLEASLERAASAARDHGMSLIAAWAIVFDDSRFVDDHCATLVSNDGDALLRVSSSEFIDLGASGIRVNAISAGPIKTLAAAGVGGFRKMLARVAATAPLKRNVTIEDVGNAAAFLCSDLAAGITGETLYVDAGFSHVGMSFAEIAAAD